MSLQQSILLCSEIVQNVTSRLCMTDVFFLLECGNRSLNIILRKYVRYCNVLYTQDMKMFSIFLKFFSAIKHIYVESGLDLKAKQKLPETLETFIAPQSTIVGYEFGSNVTRVDALYTSRCTFASTPEIVYSLCHVDEYVTEIRSPLTVLSTASAIGSSDVYPSRLSVIKIDGCPSKNIQHITDIIGIPVIYKCGKSMTCGSGRLPHCTNCGKIAEIADVVHMGDYKSFADFEGVHTMKITIRGPNDVLLLQTLPRSIKTLIVYSNVEYNGLWKAVFEALPSTVANLTFKFLVPVWEVVVTCPLTVEQLTLKQSGISSHALLKLISTNYDKLMLRVLNVQITSVQRKTMKKLNSYKRISIN